MVVLWPRVAGPCFLAMLGAQLPTNEDIQQHCRPLWLAVSLLEAAAAPVKHQGGLLFDVKSSWANHAHHGLFGG